MAEGVVGDNHLPINLGVKVLLLAGRKQMLGKPGPVTMPSRGQMLPVRRPVVAILVGEMEQEWTW